MRSWSRYVRSEGPGRQLGEMKAAMSNSPGSGETVGLGFLEAGKFSRGDNHQRASAEEARDPLEAQGRPGQQVRSRTGSRPRRPGKSWSARQSTKVGENMQLYVRQTINKTVINVSVDPCT